MKLVWISGRHLESDLAATTEISLCRSMTEEGVEVKLISPGRRINDLFEHIEVRKISIRGLNTISGAWRIKQILKERKDLLNNCDMILVDWRYVRILKKMLIGIGKKWAIIDRGPPTYLGLLNRLQKKYWFDAWKIADEHADSGFVVSEEHRDFVRNRTGARIEIGVVSAGSFQNKNPMEKSNPAEILKIIYVGRVDRRRGVAEIFRFAENLNINGIKHRITVIGNGDLSSQLSRFSEENESFDYFEKRRREEIPEILAGNHIGIMPMPDIPIWRIASPLKLAEYISSGLLIIGPSHPGNQLSGEEDWSLLTGDDWAEESIGRINEVINSDWSLLSSSALESSRSLDWNEISRKFMKDLFQ